MIWIPVALAAMVEPVSTISIFSVVALEVRAVSTTSFTAYEDELQGM